MLLFLAVFFVLDNSQYCHNYKIFTITLCTNTKNDSGGKVNILEGNSLGHCEEKFSINICLILNGYRNRALWISRPLLIFLRGIWPRTKFTKGRCVQQKNFSLAPSTLLPAQTNMKINSDQQHAIFTRELQCALRSTLGIFRNLFWNGK